MAKLRVLLADDSPEFLQMMSGFLARDSAIELIGAALTGQDAVKLAAELHPDLILMDLIMPHTNGIEATRQIKATPYPPIVIILTGHDTPEYRSKAANAGADGFVYKPELFKKLLPLMKHLVTYAKSKHHNRPDESSPFCESCTHLPLI